MELIIHLNSDQYISDFIDMNIQNFIVGTKYFSARTPFEFDYKSLEKLVNRDVNVYVLVNALIEQPNLGNLKDHLNELNELNIKGIIFHDFAVMQICKEENYQMELVYQPETLNTNSCTINVLGKQGISGAFLAREISLVEKNKIVNELDNIKSFIQIHGSEFISYSKRRLLSNYFSYTKTKKDTNDLDKYTIQANDTDLVFHIYEDKFGCHIMSKKQLCCLDILSQIECDYGYIDSMYITPSNLIEVAYFYKQALDSIRVGNFGKVKDELMPMMNRLSPHQDYYHSFMFDNTVYKIDDVREKDNEQK